MNSRRTVLFRSALFYFSSGRSIGISLETLRFGRNPAAAPFKNRGDGAHRSRATLARSSRKSPPLPKSPPRLALAGSPRYAAGCVVSPCRRARPVPRRGRSPWSLTPPAVRCAQRMAVSDLALFPAALLAQLLRKQTRPHFTARLYGMFFLTSSPKATRFLSRRGLHRRPSRRPRRQQGSTGWLRIMSSRGQLRRLEDRATTKRTAGPIAGRSLATSQ
jgi:hypothetical protein